jgi:23S rRNA G2445 N2-methylase RlmL
LQIKALSFMGFSRLVFLSFLVFLSCMQKREEKKTTVYNFCYTHDFFAFSIYIFFLEIFN